MMTPHEAQQVLLSWRPGCGLERDPEVAEALECAQRDSALGCWLEEQKQFHRKMQASLREVPLPEGLAEHIATQSRSARLTAPGWRWIIPLAAAAVLMVSLLGWWLRPAPADSFPQFRDRMVRAVVRQYAMDIVSNDMTEIRRFLAQHQAPADYVLPQALARLPATGAGLLRWQDRRVSMVCLNSGEQGTLFLFIVDSAAVLKGPGQTPDFEPVSKLATASWSQGGKTYVLAGPGGVEFLGRYL